MYDAMCFNTLYSHKEVKTHGTQQQQQSIVSTWSSTSS